MKEKVVLLNSGGFDSICLAHRIKHEADYDVTNLFFNYGQLNYKSERRCSYSCSKLLGFRFKEITLPPFSWSNSCLTDGDSDSQYINWRNLVFLSYAISLAEALGAKKVFTAFIKSEDGEYFSDTSPIFCSAINEMLDLTNTDIQIHTPLIDDCKANLAKYVRKYGIAQCDFHSCNMGETPCGFCGDCEAIDTLYQDYVYPYATEDIYIDHLLNGSELLGFNASYVLDDVTTAKLYINNKCQFDCSHCFIGHRYSSTLCLAQWLEKLEELKEAGIRHIDFFGKEPLYDAKIFPMLEKCQELGLTYSLITNGVNVEKYIDPLTKYKPEVTVSLEAFNNRTTLRNTGLHLKKTLKLLNSRHIITSVSIDLSQSNYKQLSKLIRTIEKCGVYNIYIKPVRPMGYHEEELYMNYGTILTSEQLFDALNTIAEQCRLAPYLNITYALSAYELRMMHKVDPKRFKNTILKHLESRDDYYAGDTCTLELELFCNRFRNSICITPNGHVLGCASEYCCENPSIEFDSDVPVIEAIRKGKKHMIDSPMCTGCYFNKYFKLTDGTILD